MVVLPVPGTGRERNIIFDAGDLLEAMMSCGVDIIFCGHKHVPHVWLLGNTLVVNAGTVSSMKLRGRGKPCYNLLTLDDDHIRIDRKYPFGERELTAEIPWDAVRNRDGTARIGASVGKE